MLSEDAVYDLITDHERLLKRMEKATLLSAFFLREPITIWTVIGAVMILGATAVSELGTDKDAA